MTDERDALYVVMRPFVWRHSRPGDLWCWLANMLGYPSYGAMESELVLSWLTHDPSASVGEILQTIVTALPAERVRPSLLRLMRAAVPDTSA